MDFELSDEQRAFAETARAFAAWFARAGLTVTSGLAVGIELVHDRGSREPVPVTTTAKVVYRAWQLGAVFFYVGLRGNVLELTPPLTLREAEVEEGVAIIDRAMTDVGQGAVTDAEVRPFMMW